MMNSRKLSRLLHDLVDGDATRRRAAADSLAEADERAVYPLIRALRDESPGVQDAAMRSLSGIGGETTAYMTLPLLREDACLRNIAIIILREIGPTAVPLLYPLLKDKDDDVRKFSIDLLMDIREGVDPAQISPLIGDPNPNVRASAAKAMGILAWRGSVPDLVRALRDEEWVCFSAIEALGELGDEAAVGPIEAILSLPSETIRCAAVEALGRIGGCRAAEVLHACLPKTGGFEKQAVIRSLLLTGNVPRVEGVGEALMEMFREGSWEERITCLRGIVAFGNAAYIREIVDTAGSLDPSDPEGEDRLFAVRNALMETGCAGVLAGLLKDPDLRFRGRVLVIDVIGDLRCREAVQDLIRLARIDVRDVRRASVAALGEIADGESTPALLCAVEDCDSHVRKAAVVALGKIGAREAIEPILNLLKSEQCQDIITEAVTALLSIDREGFLAVSGTFETPVRETVELLAGGR
ncbi:MAG: HEAT repeat domain-containing protein [Nitrospiraceae bacterium]|nr:HEAT repeat domain-containing protein [Nitrospiraceae bacterium]